MPLTNLIYDIYHHALISCRRINASAVLVVTSMLIAPLGYAHHHETEGHHQQQGEDPAVAAYQAANDKMHEDMAMSFTGNPDVDFARGMIPHHEGAIAMAEIVLQYGDDEDIRQLAEEIIAAQESEIAFLKEWLDKKGH